MSDLQLILSWKEILTAQNIIALVAIYGATLSTINLVREIRKERVRLKVSGSIATVGYGKGYPAFVVNVVNESNFPVSISCAGILLPNKHQLIFPPAPDNLPPNKLPLEISSKNGDTIWVGVYDLQKSFCANNRVNTLKVIPFVKAANGNRFQGKPVSLDLKNLDDWLSKFDGSL